MLINCARKKNIEITGPLIFLKDSAKRGMYFMHGAYKHRILLQRLLHKKKLTKPLCYVSMKTIIDQVCLFCRASISLFGACQHKLSMVV